MQSLEQIIDYSRDARELKSALAVKMSGFRAHNLPIGSEAACKVLVKQCLCGSGMRWKEKGAKVVLSLRALSESTGRWTQFWDKINQFGVIPC